MAERLKRVAFRALKPVLRAVYRQTRGMTLGTRVVVLKEQAGEVLLVRHGYAPGWLLPGGGVERGEALAQSAVREVREEAGIVAEEEPVLHGIFLNDAQFKGDHVACYVLRRFRAEGFTPNGEIAEARFFPLTALPDGTTPGTRRRLCEVLEGAPVPAIW
ncbi:MAG: NUDIX domain-containing protein [Aestuariivirga sp.]|uniref:NUDIX domain-containing protein n=1 Tax=Aestuariivirga sp. TaxID=2650926 RepID=UPI0025C726C0|nr:NUDIX domain-containing protein [Aestuariivirga sp.]MCA3559860.1 NUDIX domain-containing protein [Aestuariivirga sp.]